MLGCMQGIRWSGLLILLSFSDPFNLTSGGSSLLLATVQIYLERKEGQSSSLKYKKRERAPMFGSPSPFQVFFRKGTPPMAFGLGCRFDLTP